MNNVVKEEKINIDEIINQIGCLLKKCQEEFTETRFEDTDIRKRIFLYLNDVLQNLLFNFIFAKKLVDIDFYSANKIDKVSTKEQMTSLQNSYINYVSDTFFISVYVYIEYYLRTIGEFINADKINISKTFSILVKKYEIKEEIHTLWKIVSKVRNVAHNLGYSKYEESLTYKDQKYQFEKGKLAQHSGINNYLYYSEELINGLIFDLNNKSPKELIEDKTHKLSFEKEP